MKQFTEIPGCVLWLEVGKPTPTNPTGIWNKLKEAGIASGDVFVWEDPNNPDQGIIVAYGRELTTAEREQVEERLIQLTQPSMAELP